MIEPKAFLKMEYELAQLLAQKHGLTKGLFELRLKKALHRAPRAVQQAADGFLQARTQMGHPKLMRLMDPAKAEADFQTLRTHLRAIDVADRRKGLVLGILGSVSFNLLVVAVALLIWLLWRGYL